jgi:two-component system, NtrC family, sensor kinase
MNPRSDSTLADPKDHLIANLHRELAELTAERDELFQQQAATAEVLGVINSSPGDIAPVFDAILKKARSLCDAAHGDLWTYDGDVLHLAATHGEPGFAEWLRQQGPVPVWPGSPAERLLHGAGHVQFEDPVRDGLFDAAPEFLAEVLRAGIRSTLFVPMRTDGALLGTIIVYRREVRPFTGKQIALLQSFAAQAVIATENARLLNETREALEQQTATAEILRVISSSPTDAAPTFDAIAESAARLCGADFSAVARFEDGLLQLAATSNMSEAELVASAARGVFPRAPSRDFVMGRAFLDHQPVLCADVLAEPDYNQGIRDVAQSAIPFRTILAVPVLRHGEPIGAINLCRRRVEPFTERQIDLVRSFADQAVIAIENVRLFNELNQRTSDLQESLEYQTATSDVLQVISRSTFDLQPVLDIVCETARRLCSAGLAGIAVRSGEIYRYVATSADRPEWAAFLSGADWSPGRDSVAGRASLGRRVIHIENLADDPEYRHPATAGLGAARTALGVPLLREGEPLGVIFLGHDRVRPFTERQIELVRTFADQAVIAIENTRLITETREALEQQQAMAEVLEVINRSPGDLQPVFDAILEKAHSLCSASGGTLFLFDGELFRAAARQGYSQGGAAPPTAIPASGDPRLSALAGGEELIHTLDMAKADDPIARAVAEKGGVRSNLLLSLRKDDALLGVLSCSRREVRPFSEKEIRLLQSFAAQAVIAMDNARLLGEIHRRQAELRVTFENMGDGVAMFDTEMRLAAWNMNFQKILDLPNEFVAEHPTLQQYFQFMEARGEYGSAAPELESEIRRGIAIAEHESRFERTRPDGRIIEVRRNAVPGGGSVLIFTDITERKRAEEEIHAARDAAETALGELKLAQANLIQAEKMASLGQLTAGIAHEIKNPLNFVNNFAGLSVELLDELKETTAPAVAVLGEDKRAEVDETIELLTGNLEKIAEHGRRADNIVKSMLEHSRGVGGERRAVDLNALVDEALNLAYHGARAQDQSFNITLERDFAPALPPIELAPQEMTRVFLNLFGNGFYAATKRARESGNVAFRPTLTVATRTSNDAIEITVRDNGAGIPPEIRDKLFQPFFTTKPTGEGTGLGLSISYDIVTQQHGGTITVDSEPGVFTEFTIRLPHGHRATAEAF